MKRVPGIAIVSVASAMLAAPTAGVAEQKQDAPAVVVSRYSTEVDMAAPAGPARTPLRVEVKDLLFVKTPQEARLPEGPFYLAQLKSGEIQTEVAGKKELRLAGDIWTVAAGEPMIVSFRPHGQAGQLRIVTIAPVTGK
jgi:hypothetical protein